MLDGCLDWQAQGLVRPASVSDATASYFSEQDLFGQWLEEDCNIDRDGTRSWFQSSTVLFESWSKYAKAAGDDPGKIKGFAGAMRRHGFRSEHKKSGNVWHGVDLKQDKAAAYRRAREGEGSGEG